MPLRLLLMFLLLLAPLVTRADDELVSADRTATLEFLLERAISRNLISGGVLVVGNRDGILYSAARGRISSAPDAPPITERTIFDVASLTKVLAATPAVMRLLDSGRISLMDPLSRWFPELAESEHADVLILNLLTHTSGLDDIPIAGEEPMKNALQGVANLDSGRQSGYRFRYADINFILLGEVINRASGYPLDSFCRQQFFEQLAMGETFFKPPGERLAEIAPTAGEHAESFRGIVQDENARRLGGVAGHAGLFSSAADVARFAQMILGGGELGGKRVLSQRVITQMVSPYFFSNGKVIRGLGWDIVSPYSAPKGTGFSDLSFGHTGYSGSSLWIDPQANLFVVLLTNRRDYHDKRQFNRLRSDISTLAAAAFLLPETGAPPTVSISP